MSELGPSAVVVVTGASAGIGRATVRELARRGARIGLVARGRERLEAAAREVEELGGRALVLPLDVADAVAVEAAAARTEEAFGPLEAWINNAMLSVFSPIAELTAAEVRRVTEVTYLGVVHGTQAALRRMLPRDRGTSCRSARRSPGAPSRCRPPTAPPSTRCSASPTPCAASCGTSAARCG